MGVASPWSAHHSILTALSFAVYSQMLLSPPWHAALSLTGLLRSCQARQHLSHQRLFLLSRISMSHTGTGHQYKCYSKRPTHPIASPRAVNSTVKSQHLSFFAQRDALTKRKKQQQPKPSLTMNILLGTPLTHHVDLTAPTPPHLGS